MNKVVINLYFIENVLKFTNLQILGTQVSDNYFWLDKQKKKSAIWRTFLFDRINYCLKGVGIIFCKVCERFPVEFDILLMKLTHELGIRHPVFAHGSINPDDPQTSEVPFFGSSVAECIHLSFFVRIFSNRPDVLSLSKLSFDLLEDFFSPLSRCYCIY